MNELTGALQRIEEVLEHYQAGDDGVVKLLAGFKETKDTVDCKSPARQALTLIAAIRDAAPELNGAVCLLEHNNAKPGGLREELLHAFEAVELLQTITGDKADE